MARVGFGDEAVREGAEVRRLATEEPAGEPDRVDDGRRDPAAGQAHRLVVEERHVEACVVRDEHGVAAELEEAADARCDRRRAAQLGVAQPVSAAIAGCSGAPGLASVWKRSSQLEAAHADGADLAGARCRVAGRSSRGRRRRRSPVRAAGGRPPGGPAQRGRPPQRRRASAARPRRGASGRARRHRAPSFSTFLAASSAGTGPRRSSTSSTSRSAASRRSCMTVEATTNIRSCPPRPVEQRDCARAPKGPQGRVRGQLRERPDPPLPSRAARSSTVAARAARPALVFRRSVLVDRPARHTLRERRRPPGGLPTAGLPGMPDATALGTSTGKPGRRSLTDRDPRRQADAAPRSGRPGYQPWARGAPG